MTYQITSAEEFVRLRSSQLSEEYLSAAWGEASDEVWLEVIEKFPDFAAWVAHNKTIPPNIIGILAAHPDGRVRHFIASKRKTPPEILQLLAQDVDEGVRQRVAYNMKTPREILLLLRDDPCESIREGVVKRLSE